MVGTENPSYREIRSAVRAELVKRARKRMTITYGELVVAASLPFGPRSPALNELLADISTAEHGFGRPLLTALVVSKEGQPGNGFFTLARVLGYLIPDKLQFWTEQVRLVYGTRW